MYQRGAPVHPWSVVVHVAAHPAAAAMPASVAGVAWSGWRFVAVAAPCTRLSPPPSVSVVVVARTTVIKHNVHVTTKHKTTGAINNEHLISVVKHNIINWVTMIKTQWNMGKKSTVQLLISLTMIKKVGIVCNLYAKGTY